MPPSCSTSSRYDVLPLIVYVMPEDLSGAANCKCVDGYKLTPAPKVVPDSVVCILFDHLCVLCIAPKVVADSVVCILFDHLRVLCLIDALGPCFSERLGLATNACDCGFCPAVISSLKSARRTNEGGNGV